MTREGPSTVQKEEECDYSAARQLGDPGDARDYISHDLVHVLRLGVFQHHYEKNQKADCFASLLRSSTSSYRPPA
jgi:hypothetical protein